MSIIAETAELRWGYTMADVDRIAGVAVRQARGARQVSLTDRWDDAWHGVVEALYAAQEEPHVHDLIAAGANEVSRTWKAGHDGFFAGGEAARHNTMRYWRSVVDHVDFTERCDDRLGLYQALALLDAREYEVLVTVAAHGSVKAAAIALGLKQPAVSHVLGRARAVIASAWYAPETPRMLMKRPPSSAAACRNGHDRAEHGYVDNQGKQACTLCRRDSDRRRRARRSNAELDRDREKARIAMQRKRDERRAVAIEGSAA